MTNGIFLSLSDCLVSNGVNKAKDIIIKELSTAVKLSIASSVGKFKL